MISACSSSKIDACEFPDHIYTTLDQLCANVSNLSANQILHIYESNEGLGIPYKIKSHELKSSKVEDSLQTSEIKNSLYQRGSFCGETLKKEKKFSEIQLTKEKTILGFVVSSPLGFWPSAPTITDHSIDMGQNGTVIISYIKDYRGSHKIFKTNFLAFHAYIEDKRIENGYGFPLAVNGTLKGENILFIKNAVTLTTSRDKDGSTTYTFEREEFYTRIEEPFADQSGNILRFEVIRRSNDTYLRIHPLTENTGLQDTQLTEWARMLSRLSFNRQLYSRNQKLLTPAVASSSLLDERIISTKDLSCLLPLAPQIISFSRNCLGSHDLLQTLSVPVKSLLKEAVADPLVMIGEPCVYNDATSSSTAALDVRQKLGDALRLKAKGWLSKNLPGFEKAGEYFEGPVSMPTKQTTKKRELSDSEIVSLIRGQLTITPTLLDLSGLTSVNDKHLKYLASQRNTGAIQMINLSGTSITAEGVIALGKSRYLGRNRVDTAESKISIIIKDSPAAKDFKKQERLLGELCYQLLRKNFSIIDPVTGKKTKGGKKILRVFS